MRPKKEARVGITLVFLGLSIALLLGCDQGRQNRSELKAISPDTWQYPIKLGTPRANVHELLGFASRSTPELEEYPSSGVTVWFDNNNLVTKMNFAGEASAIYSMGPAAAPIPSDRQVVFGLTGHTDEAGFRRILGSPKRETQERSTANRELHCVWRRDGYAVDALFLVAERSDQGQTYPTGTLVWFEIYRGL